MVSKSLGCLTLIAYAFSILFFLSHSPHYVIHKYTHKRTGMRMMMMKMTMKMNIAQMNIAPGLMSHRVRGCPFITNVDGEDFVIDG